MERMGMLFQLGGTFKYADGTECSGSDNIEQNRMTYGLNNGFLSFMTDGGVQYVTRASPAKLRELDIAGYTDSGLGVPFSNGQKPVPGSYEYEQWDRMMQED